MKKKLLLSLAVVLALVAIAVVFFRTDPQNGARLWTVDHIGAKVGKERDFQGLKARWVMWFPIPDAIREHKDLAYAVMTAHRDTTMGINKGSRAYILDDPQGNSWVMKSASLIVDPNQKFEDRKNLGSRLKLPAGWKFRSPILEQDLDFMTDKGTTHIIQDDLGNTYDRRPLQQLQAVR